MKVLIFGASGQTGRELVEQALDSGHVVTAFAGRPHERTIRARLR